MSVSSESVISDICAHCESIGNGCAHCCGDEPPPKAKAKPTDDIDDDCCGDEPPPKAKADRDDDFHKEPAPEAKVKPADDRDDDGGIGGWLNDWDQDKPAPNANLPDHGFSLGAHAATATDGRGSWRQNWAYDDYKTRSRQQYRGKYYDYTDLYEKLQDQETHISNLEDSLDQMDRRMRRQETCISNLEDGMDKMDRRTRTLKKKLEEAERELQWWREEAELESQWWHEQSY